MTQSLGSDHGERRMAIPLNHRLPSSLPGYKGIFWSWNHVHQSELSGKVNPPIGQRLWNSPIYITKWEEWRDTNAGGRTELTRNVKQNICGTWNKETDVFEYREMTRDPLTAIKLASNLLKKNVFHVTAIRNQAWKKIKSFWTLSCYFTAFWCSFVLCIFFFSFTVMLNMSRQAFKKNIYLFLTLPLFRFRLNVCLLHMCFCPQTSFRGHWRVKKSWAAGGSVSLVSDFLIDLLPLAFLYSSRLPASSLRKSTRPQPQIPA